MLPFLYIQEDTPLDSFGHADNSPCMAECCALLFSKSDNRHFGNATFHLTVEGRMGLYPVDQNHSLVLSFMIESFRFMTSGRSSIPNPGAVGIWAAPSLISGRQVAIS